MSKQFLSEYLTPKFSNLAVVMEDSEDAFGNKGKQLDFLYKWTQLSTGKWYIGSRTAKRCHPSDGYICSSKVVKTMIAENAQDWKREILIIGDPKYIRTLESKYLTLIDAKNESMSFNRDNANGKFTTLGVKQNNEWLSKRVKKLTGLKKPEGFAERVGNFHRGKIVSEKTKMLIGKASTGRVQSKEARLKNSIANSGIQNGNWSGYWTAPIGEKFTSRHQAHLMYPEIGEGTIRAWSKKSKNGWSFEPSGVQHG